MKPVVARERADRDIDEAIEYYAQEAPQSALNLIAALAAAFGHISESPKAGSPRYSEPLQVPGLRYAVVARFPYVIFYIERAQHVDVIRVLHQQRDIAALMLGELP